MLIENFKKIKEQAQKHVSVNKRVLAIFIISIVWISVYKLYLADEEEIFPKAHEIAEITFNLLSSVVASCIFYYFVVYVEQRRVAKVLNPNLINRIRTFYTSRFTLLIALCEAKGIILTEPTNYQQLLEVCDGIKLRSTPPNVHGHHGAPFNNWFELFYRFFDSDRITAKQLYAYAPHLPPEILHLLDDLYYSPLELALHQYMNEPLESYSDEMSNLAGMLFHYIETLRKIVALSEAKLR